MSDTPLPAGFEEVFSTEVPFRTPYRLLRARFGSGAPHLSVVAGVHGTEISAVLAANLLCQHLAQHPPNITVSVVPCVNTVAAEEGRKRWPFDDRDVYQALPGSPTGLPIERVADAVLTATQADVGVDVQSGSLQMRELPHVRAAADEPLADRLGVARWVRPAERLAALWRARGQRGLVLRGGQSGPAFPEDAHGLFTALCALIDRLSGGAGAAPGPRFVGVHEYRALRGGIFLPEVAVGARVEPGTALGAVVALVGGELREPVVAREPGVVVALRTWPVVHGHELLVRVMAPTDS